MKKTQWVGVEIRRREQARAEREALASQPVWQVLRHGGRSRDTWRVAAAGTEEAARRKYAQIAEDLRQGGVRLISPEGQQIAATGGPRLRTRW